MSIRGSAQAVGKSIDTKKENVPDIPSMSQPVLLETLERQRKLLSNKQFIAKLPDKGARIKDLKDRLEEEVKRREKEISDLCEVIEGLTVNGQEFSESLEWEGKCHPGVSTTKVEKKEIDTEEEERNPFKILSFHSSVKLKKIVKQEPMDPPLIKPSDLEDIDMKDSVATTSEMDRGLPDIKYIKKQCDKLDKVVVKERFVLHKPLKSDPPKIKPLSLEESIKVQMKQEQILKEVYSKHAAERLKEKLYVIGDKLPSSSTEGYRDVQLYQSDDEEEIADEED